MPALLRYSSVLLSLLAVTLSVNLAAAAPVSKWDPRWQCGKEINIKKYHIQDMVDMLKEKGGEQIRIFGGGGGVIIPAEIQELHDYGVTRLYSPEDGQKMGLQGMILSEAGDFISPD